MTFKPENIQPLQGRLGEYFSYIIAGAGGTGKSTLLGSMAEYIKKIHNKKTLLIATLPREINSWKYQELGADYFDHVIMVDQKWRPDLREKIGAAAFQANAFYDTLQLLNWLETDDKYGAVIFDNGTEHAEQAWHAALAPMGVSSPAEIEGRSRWLPYERLASMLDQSVKMLVGLTTAPSPKVVGISWHVQAPKDDTVESTDGLKVTKTSADNAGKGVEYEGEVLPMIRGQYRRKLASQVDAMLYTDVQNEKKIVAGKIQASVNYLIQVRVNDERHTKLPGKMPDVPYIPNDYAELVKVLKGGYVAKEADATVNNKSGLKKP